MPVTTIQIRWPDIFRFHIAPGTENQIAVTPTLMSTSSNAMSRSTLQRKNICLSRLLWPLEWYWPGSTLSKGIVTMKMKLLSSPYHGTMVTGVVLCHCAIVPLCHYAIMPLCHCAIALLCQISLAGMRWAIACLKRPLRTSWSNASGFKYKYQTQYIDPLNVFHMKYVVASDP